jgi:iron(II)-dependent oxidoreductase
MSHSPVDPQTLGALSRQQQLLIHVVQNLPESDVNRRFHPDLPAIGWLLGRAVYLELYWLRERLHGDAELSGRVRHLFARDVVPDVAIEAQLPPKDHLLNWALEVFDTDLTGLANPGQDQDAPLLQNNWLPNWLLQSLGQLSEQMMATLLARSIQADANRYRVARPLTPALPRANAAEVSQGHYRIGAREGVVFDNERPVQMVELSSFRIARQPVSNAQYLAFIEDGGYRHPALWDEAGQAWLKDHTDNAPWHWRRDERGHWYGIGLNGAADLPHDDPVSGLCHHEARAFANWADSLGGELAGAVLQHEYQWEVAARTGAISGFGRAWEWCSQPLFAYDQYQPPGDPELASDFGGERYALRGGCLHTQPALRRASLRGGQPAGQQAGFCGLRLVLPPGTPFWEQGSREAGD